jgi:hypothetical protein
VKILNKITQNLKKIKFQNLKKMTNLS